MGAAGKRQKAPVAMVREGARREVLTADLSAAVPRYQRGHQ